MTKPEHRLVVCLPAAGTEPFRLPPAAFVERPWIWGGVRALHQLAFAAASAGLEVELRGWLDKATFDELEDATGRPPVLDDSSREPDERDVVLVPEGHEDPLVYAQHWLAPGQLVLMVLGPLGLMGWPFAAGWERPSPQDVTADEVNRPEYFAALAAMHIPVWANARPIVAMARDQGVHVSVLGRGQPTPFSNPPAEKTVDVVWLEDNRWAPLAGDIAANLRCSVATIAAVDHATMLQRLGEARILLYPGGVEGDPRVTLEARAMGTVPVVPRGNPMGEHLTESDGVLVVERRDLIPTAISALLEHRQRLASFADRGVHSARAEVAWEPYVKRVAQAFQSLPDPDASAAARGVIGKRLVQVLEGTAPSTVGASELEAELARVRDRKDELEAELARVRDRKDELEEHNAELEAELERLRRRKDEAEAERSAMLERRAVRWSMALADLRNRRPPGQP